MTPDDRLSAFLGEAPAPRACDVFVAEVMEAVERRMFVDRLMAGGAAAFAGGAVLWACSPALNLAVDILAPTLVPVAGMLVLAAAAAILADRLLPRK
ncbi:MAG: hypothetical protein B7Z44_10115 [Caulobacter sp. 12-67-6]|nr:MAG: hypothetical protein B7Z44_10115 [Caulobacter sp. 12-67-6]OYX71281.1 MAG: hypothetical protein B7Y81_09420 [Caulobacter sp. 32-67-35]OZA76114.1 MAG: hypothetical protein B7X77_06330 [Caulobacter sp. 39-67-4]HQR89104.1 hypothetical protein [Caulobacter sp.]